MDEFKQTVGCNLVLFRLFLIENTGPEHLQKHESIPRVVRLEHLNIFGDPNPFEPQNTTKRPDDQTTSLAPVTWTIATVGKVQLVHHPTILDVKIWRINGEVYK